MSLIETNKQTKKTSKINFWVFVGLLCCVIQSCAIQTSKANTSSEYQNSINKVVNEIKAISKNLNANKSLVKTEKEELFELEQDLHKQRQSLSRLEKEREQQQQQINTLELEMQTALKKLASSKQALKSLIVAEYKAGNANYLKLLLNQQNPYAVGRLSNYQQYFSKELNTKFVNLNQQLSLVSALQEEQRKKQSELEKQQAKQQETIKTLEKNKQRRAKVVAKLDKKISTSSEKLEKLKQDRSRLKSLLKQIKLKAQELAKAEQARAQQAGQTPKPQPKRQLVAGGFKKQKGRLSYPINVKHQIAFGARLPESGMTSDGMFFNTQQSINVKSIFRGRVLFADNLKGYGLLLIIDHGDEHISLYGHNEVIYKKVGDTVSTNEVISKTGVSGGLKKPGLYFEIRNNATPVNPARWCQ